MVRISDSRGRSDENSGYIRLLGNSQLGHLLSKVQSSVIRAGNELEHIIEQSVPNELKTTLPAVFGNQHRLFKNNIEYVFQAKIPKKPGEKRSKTADLIIIDHGKKTVTVVEIKDGDTFDTKKSGGELSSLQKVADYIQTKLSDYEINFSFCSFNQEDKNAIVTGAKRQFSLQQVMTGRELCAILNIDYDQIIENRKSDQAENFAFFVDTLLEIIPVKRRLIEKLKDNHEC